MTQAELDQHITEMAAARALPPPCLRDAAELRAPASRLAARYRGGRPRSGDSFNHLHAAEVVNIGDLTDMAAAVEHVAPGSRAAVNTMLTVQLLQDDALRQVWQALEQRADGGADVDGDVVQRYESSGGAR